MSSFEKLGAVSPASGIVAASTSAVSTTPTPIAAVGSDVASGSVSSSSSSSSLSLGNLVQLLARRLDLLDKARLDAAQRRIRVLLDDVNQLLQQKAKLAAASGTDAADADAGIGADSMAQYEQKVNQYRVFVMSTLCFWHAVLMNVV
jgi:flagellar hook-associated protein FlgK